jgi:hypothetical protein
MSPLDYQINRITSCLDRFRWVACQLDALRKCSKRSELKSALKSLPKTLDDTYERILLDIDELWRDDVHRVLQLLCVAERDLRLDEVVDALAVTFIDGAKFDPDERYPDPRDILTRCSSLVSVTGVLEGSILRLAHFSVKEYLISDRILNGKAPMYAVIEYDAHELVAQTCLAYLLQFETVDGQDDSTTHTYPLLFYAAQHWLHHVRHRGSGNFSADLQELIMKLFRPCEIQHVSCIELADVDTHDRFSILHNF